ncbi:MAG: accessory factor UbiK family protein [Burkholderiales bacterium]|nr:MAG: accessory factor UbiK family protein [Burkholderiales bacterium]
MDRKSILDELQARLSAMIASTPAADLEQNLKAVLGQAFQRMDLVTREEFELQRVLLAHTRARLEALQQRLAALEGDRAEHKPAGGDHKA